MYVRVEICMINYVGMNKCLNVSVNSETVKSC